ncbi:hypothetical protein EDB82DRAFT_122196 [Fusarium venenatum]|uniref:uncharacterized protein n=1 Tax=Fusarium venenatum TaxID=56646 RepID=UPI001DBD895C|nr:hypothetical protein EDB82DRAFT_122196 [Fusarium venenatum]
MMTRSVILRLKRLRGVLPNRTQKSRAPNMKHYNNPCSFVLVLIDADADSYIFKDKYYAAGDGGKKASLDLRDGVRSFLQVNKPEEANYPIFIKAYANEHGLSQFLVASGIIKAPRDLVEFAKDFTQASENTDFVLVGSGKDRADKKIQGSFKQFVRNPTCRHIIFGACHDNSYVRLLEDYVHDDSVVDRVTLLHGFSVGREFRDLRFKCFKMEDVFKVAPAQNLAVTPQPLASVSTSSTWASTVGSKGDASSKKSKAAKTVRLNSAGHRIDDPLRTPNQQALDSWKHKVGKVGMRYCRLHHLSGSCSNASCKYSHGPLSEEEKLVFRREVRMGVCNAGLQCRDVACLYGHNCSCSKTTCKFSLEMHKVDVSEA